MKTKYLKPAVLLVSMAALTTVAFSQNEGIRKPGSAKPGTGYPVTGAPTAGDQATGGQVAGGPTTGRTTERTDRTTTEEKVMVRPGSLTAIIADSTSFSTLTKCLKATGLDATLGSNGEYTVFAPTDEAFAKLPEETRTKLMLPENKEKLRELLLYHVVSGKVLSTDLTDGDVKTVNGEKVKIEVSTDKIEVHGAKVQSSDVSATNGVIHSIGKVLVPKSLDGFAGL